MNGGPGGPCVAHRSTGSPRAYGYCNPPSSRFRASIRSLFLLGRALRPDQIFSRDQVDRHAVPQRLRPSAPMPPRVHARRVLEEVDANRWMAHPHDLVSHCGCELGGDFGWHAEVEQGQAGALSVVGGRVEQQVEILRRARTIVVTDGVAADDQVPNLSEVERRQKIDEVQWKATSWTRASATGIRPPVHRARRSAARACVPRQPIGTVSILDAPVGRHVAHLVRDAICQRRGRRLYRHNAARSMLRPVKPGASTFSSPAPPVANTSVPLSLR